MGVPFDCFANASRLPARRQQVHQRQHEPDPAAVGRPGPQRRTPATPVRARGCSCGTAPPTPLVPYSQLREEIEQWTNVLGVSQTPAVHRHAPGRLEPHVGTPTPAATSRSRRTASRAPGTACRPAGMAAVALAFFGLQPDPATPPVTTPPADHAADHRRRPPRPSPPPRRRPRRPAPGACRVTATRQRLEHRPDREPDHHQHRYQSPSTAGRWPSPCPAGRPSPPAGTPPTRPPVGAGDGP